MKNNLKFLRRSQGFNLTQQQLADELKVSRHTIISIENGSNTTGEMVIKIGHFFNKDPRDIFL
ncbi:putative transcriptional regulator [Gracilibacillus orientalis]|uniref:Putative transcriptional regulator n=1 Tax=Gracilibacillus orientalis TaxID=334253 RepID=A0A1I4PLF8_9BACI|nr:helix-turn-helix domain-containing protein [Gracilibacillus orientalis]SFM28597.1 putative transcriptional regulator [Gracilibacillus orientalis]